MNPPANAGTQFNPWFGGFHVFSRFTILCFLAMSTTCGIVVPWPHAPAGRSLNLLDQQGSPNSPFLSCRNALTMRKIVTFLEPISELLQSTWITWIQRGKKPIHAEKGCTEHATLCWAWKKKVGATGDKEELKFNKILKAKCGWVYQLWQSGGPEKNSHSRANCFLGWVSKGTEQERATLGSTCMP